MQFWASLQFNFNSTWNIVWNILLNVEFIMFVWGQIKRGLNDLMCVCDFCWWRKWENSGQNFQKTWAWDFLGYGKSYAENCYYIYLNRVWLYTYIIRLRPSSTCLIKLTHVYLYIPTLLSKFRLEKNTTTKIPNQNSPSNPKSYYLPYKYTGRCIFSSKNHEASENWELLR